MDKRLEEIKEWIRKGYDLNASDTSYLIQQAQEKQKLEEALGFYADKKTYKLGVKISMGSAFPYHEPIQYDQGEKARQALEDSQ